MRPMQGQLHLGFAREVYGNLAMLSFRRANMSVFRSIHQHRVVVLACNETAKAN